DVGRGAVLGPARRVVARLDDVRDVAGGSARAGGAGSFRGRGTTRGRRLRLVDPYAHLKESCWRESADLDARLAAGEIDEREWHRAWQEILVPAYLGARTPWGQSGKTGTEEDWMNS